CLGGIAIGRGSIASAGDLPRRRRRLPWTMGHPPYNAVIPAFCTTRIVGSRTACKSRSPLDCSILTWIRQAFGEVRPSILVCASAALRMPLLWTPASHGLRQKPEQRSARTQETATAHPLYLSAWEPLSSKEVSLPWATHACVPTVL